VSGASYQCPFLVDIHVPLHFLPAMCSQSRRCLVDDMLLHGVYSIGAKQRCSKSQDANVKFSQVQTKSQVIILSFSEFKSLCRTLHVGSATFCLRRHAFSTFYPLHPLSSFDVNDAEHMNAYPVFLSLSVCFSLIMAHFPVYNLHRAHIPADLSFCVSYDASCNIHGGDIVGR
jgi:hypothetical protein